MITEEQKEEVAFRIDQEGIDYSLRNYSDFKEIQDEEFHRRRLAYIEAADAFEEYVGIKDV